MPPKAAPRRAPVRRTATTGDASADPTTQSAAASMAESRATPTAGPSGASTRAPVQRLQSLKKGTPGGSIARAQPSGLGDDAAAKPVLKYKPRAVGRRSKEEREAIEKLEAERYRERLAEAAAIQKGRGGPARGGFGRGRGGPLGTDVSGPLGSGSAGRRGRGGAFGGRFGTDSRASSISRRSKSVVGGASGAASQDVSSDESDSGIRVSIDQINLESDEELDEAADDKVKGKMPVKGPARGREKGLRPIRVERHEHEERGVSVNLEASSSTSADLRRQAKEKAGRDDALFVEDEDDQQPAETEPRVKEEPTDGDVVMTDTIPHVEDVGETSLISDDGFLPKQKVKVRRKVSMKEKEKEKEQEKAAVKDARSLLRTKEEIEEFERHEHDLEVMKDLLSVEEIPPVQEPIVEAADGAADEKTTTEEELIKDKHSGQLFLIQFPPMTPNLIIPKSDEEEAADGADHAAEGDVPPARTAQPDGPAVKREEDGAEVQEVGAKTVSKEPAKVVTATDQHLRAGRVGKLNLHASGRVTMDWGGISFELDRATEVDFLQEALIVSSASTAAAEEVPAPDEKKVWAMGQLSGKFVVTPDWEAML